MDQDRTARAIRLRAEDTVAVVIQRVRKGDRVTITGPGAPVSVTAAEDIPCYHKIALSAVQPGQSLLRNAIPIGAALAEIGAGDWVHSHNLASGCSRRAGEGADG
ncbi:UxaA family hydrolase [Frigidibacter sp. ROC022]|uniref:UxaA family hydrolase n=1 Tax=Frigidibacter sp. ROC022 TaxID=2971796 RepID=UPI00215B5828|nr:UxaA family hydrolase [Frigidibacter sp. ROC022]MCR8726011.1 UxaA family hydrolase [Frigidibacter sp. ROC022]